MRQERAVNIIGAGLAGLSAAKTLAAAGVHVRLFSVQASERAQSNLAEGGINAALNVMGEEDSVQEHYADTLRGGCDLADPNMVRTLTEEAPGIVRELEALGVPFHREEGRLVQRSFGGQKKKRTAYVKSSTGKMLMTALIDAVRRYEAAGLVERYPHHRFERLLLKQEEAGRETAGAGKSGADPVRSDREEERTELRAAALGESRLQGVRVRDLFRDEMLTFPGPVLMACGGLNGLFPGITTGTTANTGSAAAALFAQGVAFGNLEFLQYHPTTVAITGKRLLISEAARGEGGRLFCRKADTAAGATAETAAGATAGTAAGTAAETANTAAGADERIYFMEEKYGARGNLMPRDVISREMARLDEQVYLDLTGLSRETWDQKLSDLREEVQHYLGLDPAAEPVPVSPGIHFFMGGILTDERHRTSLPHLYAAGECACAYHGANRLGGNSLLGAVLGGRVAANTILQEEGFRCTQAQETDLVKDPGTVQKTGSVKEPGAEKGTGDLCDSTLSRLQVSPWRELRPDEETANARMGELLLAGLPILRSEETIRQAQEAISGLEVSDPSDEWSDRRLLAFAMLESACARRESRGAHTRTDCPDTLEEYRRTTRAQLRDGRICITFEEIPQLKDAGEN